MLLNKGQNDQRLYLKDKLVVLGEKGRGLPSATLTLKF